MLARTYFVPPKSRGRFLEASGERSSTLTLIDGSTISISNPMGLRDSIDNSLDAPPYSGIDARRLARLNAIRADVRAHLRELSAPPLLLPGVYQEVPISESVFELQDLHRAITGADKQQRFLAGIAALLNVFHAEAAVAEWLPAITFAQVELVVRARFKRFETECLLRQVQDAITRILGALGRHRFIGSLVVRLSRWFRTHGDHPPHLRLLAVDPIGV